MIAAEFTEPVVHNSPDSGDALAFICVGIAICLILKALIWVSNRANMFWADREERATVAAEHAATKTRTYVDAWAGTREGAARAQASIDAGECRITLTTLRRLPKKTTRLAQHRRKYGRDVA